MAVKSIYVIVKVDVYHEDKEELTEPKLTNVINECDYTFKNTVPGYKFIDTVIDDMSTKGAEAYQ